MRRRSSTCPRSVFPATEGALVENGLDETIGIEDGPLTTFFGPPIDLDGTDNDGDGDLTDDLIPLAGTAAADWDRSGSPTDNPALPTDINFLEMNTCDNDGAGVPDAAPDDVLAGFVDWDILRYSFRDFAVLPGRTRTARACRRSSTGRRRIG